MSKFLLAFILGFSVAMFVAIRYSDDCNLTEYCQEPEAQKECVKTIVSVTTTPVIEECLCEPIVYEDMAAINECYINLGQKSDLLDSCKVEITGLENQVQNLIDYINSIKQ